jgi:hypothetical protein
MFNKSGFTVVEVLLSALIFSIVGAAVYRVFAIAVKADERVHSDLKRDLHVLSAVHSLEMDLNNVVGSFQGNAGEITMVVRKNGDLKRVRYWSENGIFFRAQQPAVPGQIVLPELKESRFSFGYYDPDDIKENIIWKDVWQRDVLPFAVRWQIQMYEGPGGGRMISIERTIIIPHGQWGEMAWSRASSVKEAP